MISFYNGVDLGLYPSSHLVQLFLKTFAVFEAKYLFLLFRLSLHHLKVPAFWVAF